ncbi:unnamed protein product [Mucor hiemalis]
MAVDTEYGTQHQRPFKIRKSLRELVHKPRIPKSQRFSITLPPLPPHDPKTDEYAYNVLYECQRGSLAVGYSSKTLLQFDPNPWCDADMRFTPMDIENYQLPDPTWEWISKDWMIDMTEDVDEAGWQYALKFHGASWHGNYKHFRSFVRRRRWIRLRHRSIGQSIVEEEPQSPVKTRTLVDVDVDEPSGSADSFKHENIMEKLQKCRLDRERMSVLTDAIKSTLPGLENQLLEKAVDYMELFDYDDTMYKFLFQLLEKKYDSNTKKLELTNNEKKAIHLLRFYYDIESILNKIDPSTTLSKTSSTLSL